MIKPKVITEHPVAYESFDHIEPHGTKNDNTKNRAFTREMVKRFGPDMAYMDLGCAGGGFVADFIGYDVLGVGIEGSDYNLKEKRAEWETIPDYLFTADITKPFSVVDETDNQIKFDVITAFDVLEHIHKENLPKVFDNVKKHLKDGGIFCAGIATFPDGNYHVTLEDAEWWEKFLNENGLELTDDVLNFGRHSSLNWTLRKI